MININESFVRGQIPESDLVAFWYPSPHELGLLAIDLIVPLQGRFGHNIFDCGGDSSSGRVRAGFLQVAPRARGNGVGEKLVRGLGSVAREHSVAEIYACVASQYSLDILSSVFGGERLKFLGNGDEGLEGIHLNAVVQEVPTGVLDIGLEQARAVLVDLEQKKEEDVENRYWGFPVIVDLDDLDMSDWGMPMELNHLKDLFKE